jgi:hypothetical protein
VVVEPVGDGFFRFGMLDRRPNARSGAVAQALRTRSMAWNCASVRPAAPSARAACSTSSSRRPRSAALLSIADEGLFSS